MKFRIRHADKIVGFFVVFAALALAAGIVFLGANQRWFSKDIRFTTRFSSASGAQAGTAIMMRGFQIGKVAKIELNDANEVDGEFVIYDTYYSKAKENSILELVVSPLGLGGAQLLFHPGKGESLIAPGSFVPLADSPEGQDLLDQGLVEIPVKDDTVTRLLAGVNPLIENANKTIVTINRTLTEINRALAGQSSGPLGDIVKEASSAAARADAMVADVSRQADKLLEQANAIAGNLEGATAALRDPTGLVPRLLDAKGSVKTLLDDKNALYDKISSSVSELQKTLANIQGITTALSREMPTISLTIDEGRAAIKQAQDVLTGLRNNPLLKGGIPESPERQPLSQSLREGSF
jgi:phospholipid/cholesterol/gamma-HCH transport system substrate-binding protein